MTQKKKMLFSKHGLDEWLKGLALNILRIDIHGYCDVYVHSLNPYNTPIINKKFIDEQDRVEVGYNVEYDFSSDMKFGELRKWFSTII